MRRLLVGLLATIGFLAILLVAGGAALFYMFREAGPSVPERFVMTADWREPLGETVGPASLLEFRLTPAPTVTDTVLALDRAAADPRVAGLVVALNDTSHGFAVAQELRDAVRRFRAAGKFAIAHADSFGELSPGNEGYYIAAAFDEIYLQPVGLLGLTGLMVEVPHVRTLLESLGVAFEVARRAEYKTALETFTERELSPANREMLEALLGDLSGQFVQGIAEGRDLDPVEARNLVESGPFTGDEALRARLVDGLSYAKDVLELAEGRAGTGETLELEDYAATLEPPEAAAATVALVRAAGSIRRGSGIGTDIAAEDLSADLHEIADDPDIAAVLLRIDSPGGSAVASETIAHAARAVVDAGKPLIVSMSNAAASGGYWIAMGASRIVAQPGTLTGSIGVVAGKPVLAEAWSKLGVSWGQLPSSANADIWSVNTPYDAAARARVEAIVGDLYASFTEGVAKGRGLAPERVAEIAKGRVWAGAAARELGLVDELGGLSEALAAARTALQLPADASLAIDIWPRARDPFEAALEWLSWGAASELAGLIRGWMAPGTASSLPLSVR